MIWVMRQSLRTKGESFKDPQRELQGKSLRAVVLTNANVGMRASLCGGATTQQPSDLAWASSSSSSSSSFPLTPLLLPVAVWTPFDSISQLRITKKGKKMKNRIRGIFTKVLYFSVYYSGRVRVTQRCLAVTVCNPASPTYDVPISPVSLSSNLCSYLPLAFLLFLFVCLFVCLFSFLYLNLYLLFRLLLNLLWYQNKKNLQKKHQVS